MKYIYISLLAFVAIPMIASAAYNDVSLATNTIIAVGSYNLTVTGTTAAIQSIEVGLTSFTVVMPAGSSISVKSTDKNIMTTTGVASNYVSQECVTANNTLTITIPSDKSEETAIVTPTSSVCNVPSAVSESGRRSGGGSTRTITPVAPTVTPTVPALTPTTPVKTSIVYVFAKRLAKGTTGADVLSLQKVLNADPYTRIATTGSGSPGKETNVFGGLTLQAVKKFQIKYGIATPSDAGYGLVGPKTRAKLNELTK